ncbi:MAG: hypothetical protein IJD53_04565 [Alistipes sp.]|nr:hypothetical protein [Alistipes sp.]
MEICLAAGAGAPLMAQRFAWWCRVALMALCLDGASLGGALLGGVIELLGWRVGRCPLMALRLTVGLCCVDGTLLGGVELL